MDLKQEIFNGKTYDQLLQEIHTNSVLNKSVISDLIDQVKPMIKTVQDANMVIPVIKDCMDITIRNDEQLIKVASIIQRIMSAEVKGIMGSGSGPNSLSDDEKIELLKNFNDSTTTDVNEMVDSSEKISNELKAFKKTIKEINNDNTNI